MLNISCLFIEEAKTNILATTNIIVLVWPLIAFPVIVKARCGDGGEHCTRTWLLMIGCGESGAKELEEIYLVQPIYYI